MMASLPLLSLLLDPQLLIRMSARNLRSVQDPAMSNPLARDGEPRHRRYEPKHRGVCWWGVFPSLSSIWLIGPSRWLALRDAGSGLGRAGCRGPGVRTNSPPAVPVILTH